MFRLLLFYWCASSVATAVYNEPDSGSGKDIPSKSKSPNSRKSTEGSGYSRDLNYSYSYDDTDHFGCSKSKSCKSSKSKCSKSCKSSKSGKCSKSHKGSRYSRDLYYNYVSSVTDKSKDGAWSTSKYSKGSNPSKRPNNLRDLGWGKPEDSGSNTKYTKFSKSSFSTSSKGSAKAGSGGWNVRGSSNSWSVTGN